MESLLRSRGRTSPCSSCNTPAVRMRVAVHGRADHHQPAASEERLHTFDECVTLFPAFDAWQGAPALRACVRWATWRPGSSLVTSAWLGKSYNRAQGCSHHSITSSLKALLPNCRACVVERLIDLLFLRCLAVPLVLTPQQQSL